MRAGLFWSDAESWLGVYLSVLVESGNAIRWLSFQAPVESIAALVTQRPQAW